MTQTNKNNYLLKAYKQNANQTLICNLFNDFPYSQFDAVEINRMLFKDSITDKEIEAILLDLCDRYPYFLKKKKALTSTKAGVKSVFVFWKNYYAKPVKQAP